MAEKDEKVMDLVALLKSLRRQPPPVKAEPTPTPVLIHCTDCHAITPGVSTVAHCPVCQCPRVYHAPEVPQ
jgi:hypothetical protein